MNQILDDLIHDLPGICLAAVVIFVIIQWTDLFKKQKDQEDREDQ